MTGDFLLAICINGIAQIHVHGQGGVAGYREGGQRHPVILVGTAVGVAVQAGTQRDGVGTLLPVVGNLQPEPQSRGHAGGNDVVHRIFVDGDPAMFGDERHRVAALVLGTQKQMLHVAAAGGVAHRRLNVEIGVIFRNQVLARRDALRLNAVGQRMRPGIDVTAAHVGLGIRVGNGVQKLDGFHSIFAAVIVGRGAERADGLDGFIGIGIHQLIGFRIGHPQAAGGFGEEEVGNGVAGQCLDIIDGIVFAGDGLQLRVGGQLNQAAVGIVVASGGNDQLAGFAAADAVKNVALQILAAFTQPVGFADGAIVSAVHEEVAADDKVDKSLADAGGGNHGAGPGQGCAQREGDGFLRGFAVAVKAAQHQGASVGADKEIHGLARFHLAGQQQIAAVGAGAVLLLRLVVVPAKAQTFLVPHRHTVAVGAGHHGILNLVFLFLGNQETLCGFVAGYVPGQAEHAGGVGAGRVLGGAVIVGSDQRDVHTIDVLFVHHDGITHDVERGALGRLRRDDVNVVDVVAADLLIHQTGLAAHRGDAEQILGVIYVDQLHLRVALHIVQNQAAARHAAGQQRTGIGGVGAFGRIRFRHGAQIHRYRGGGVRLRLGGGAQRFPHIVGPLAPNRVGDGEEQGGGR